MVALHALSVYNIRTFARDINLNISLSSSTNAQFQRQLVLTQGDAAVQKSVDNVPVNGKLGVVSRGSGVARMDVDVRYNVNVTENDLCKFIVEVFDKPVKLDRLREQGFTPEDLIVMSVDIVRRLIPIRSRKFPTNIAFRTWLLEFGDCPTTAPGDIPSDNRQANEWSVWKSASVT